MSRKPHAQLTLPGAEDALRQEPTLMMARHHGVSLVLGVDEAGRGPLAGPVVVGAVMIHVEDTLPAVRDSKKLSTLQRQALLAPIRAASRGWTTEPGSVQEIDTLGILAATLQAMRRAVERLWENAGRPGCLVLVDGSETIPGLLLPQRALVGGDAVCPVISAASILAKEDHDQQLLKLHAAHPQYGFDQHMGYGTAQHLQALRLHGPTAHHRRSFEPVRMELARREALP